MTNRVTTGQTDPVREILAAINQIATNPQPNELLTEQEVVEQFKISRQSLHKWRSEGRIPFLRLGSRIRYDRQKLLKVFLKAAA